MKEISVNYNKDKKLRVLIKLVSNFMKQGKYSLSSITSNLGNIYLAVNILSILSYNSLAEEVE